MTPKGGSRPSSNEAAGALEAEGDDWKMTIPLDGSPPKLVTRDEHQDDDEERFGGIVPAEEPSAADPEAEERGLLPGLWRDPQRGRPLPSD
jgi:hypothetical protein